MSTTTSTQQAARAADESSLDALLADLDCSRPALAGEAAILEQFGDFIQGQTVVKVPTPVNAAISKGTLDLAGVRMFLTQYNDSDKYREEVDMMFKAVTDTWTPEEHAHAVLKIKQTNRNNKDRRPGSLSGKYQKLGGDSLMDLMQPRTRDLMLLVKQAASASADPPAFWQDFDQIKAVMQRFAGGERAAGPDSDPKHSKREEQLLAKVAALEAKLAAERAAKPANTGSESSGARSEHEDEELSEEEPSPAPKKQKTGTPGRSYNLRHSQQH